MGTARSSLPVLMLLMGACGWDTHVVARVGEHTLTVEELAHMLARQSSVRPSRKLVERVATWWVEYQLVAGRLASGDSLLDSATVVDVMWPQARGYILGRWRAQLFAAALPLDSADLDSIYREAEYRLIQHILLRAAPSDQARAPKGRQAQNLRSRLAQGLSWRAAQAESEDVVARSRGGSIGVIRRGETDSDIEHAAFTLRPGAISPVLESRVGFHIVRRPPLDEVREEYRAGVEPMVARSLDSLHIQRLTQQRRLALTPAGLERARAAVRDPLRHMESPSVIATFQGGRFTLADLVRWLRAVPDWVHTQLERGDEQQFAAFLHSMMGYELLYLEALDHGVTLSQGEFALLKDDLARRLDVLKAALGVYPPVADDSASAPQRLQETARRVEAYLDKLTSDWEGFAGVPALLAERLKRSGRWAIYPRRFERVVERAAELQAERVREETSVPR